MHRDSSRNFQTVGNPVHGPILVDSSGVLGRLLPCFCLLALPKATQPDNRVWGALGRIPAIAKGVSRFLLFYLRATPYSFG